MTAPTNQRKQFIHRNDISILLHRRKDEKKEVSQKSERVKKEKRKRLIREIIQRTQHLKKRKIVIHKTRKK